MGNDGGGAAFASPSSQTSPSGVGVRGAYGSRNGGGGSRGSVSRAGGVGGAGLDENSRVLANKYDDVSVFYFYSSSWTYHDHFSFWPLVFVVFAFRSVSSATSTTVVLQTRLLLSTTLFSHIVKTSTAFVCTHSSNSAWSCESLHPIMWLIPSSSVPVVF